MINVQYFTDSSESWDALVEQSRQGNPFDRRVALSVAANHAGTDLHRLIGYKGNEVVGIFPVFEYTKGPISAAVSPPPRLKIGYQGPLLTNICELKRRKADSRHASFIEACLEFIEREISPSYYHIRSDPAYSDIRPFDWMGFRCTPRYTYVLDLDQKSEQLLDAFSSDARRNIRDPRPNLEIDEGGPEEIGRIIGQTKRRHIEQGKRYVLEPEFVIDLWQNLPEGMIRPYVCTIDGTYAGGIVTVESDNTVYRWQGGVKTEVNAPINDKLDWHIISEAKDRGRLRFDFLGANNRRINRYKAKFSPDLASYYELEKGTLPTRIAKTTFTRLTSLRGRRFDT